MITRFVLALAGRSSRAARHNRTRTDAEESVAAHDRWELEAVELAARIVRDRPNRVPRSTDSAGGRRRVATSLAFVALFFAGAAISAGAGDTVVGLVEGSTETTGACSGEPTTTGETTTAAAEAGDGVVLDPAPSEACSEPTAEAPADAPAESSGEAPAEVRDGAPSPQAEPAPAGPGAGAPSAAPPPKAPPGASSAPNAAATELELEAQDGDAAIVWLHRTLPDPTPPAARLSPDFARMLRETARKVGADWALVLGVLRARGGRGHVPANAAKVQALAEQLANLNAKERPRKAVRLLYGRKVVADRAVALSRFNRAVGLRALVTGLEAATSRLERRVLNDERLDIYAGGRFDVEQGRIDVRVLVLLLYLAEAHGQVTVSSLEAGHRLYSRPGVISAHIYGLAVDIAGLANKPIYGNQEPGGLTEKAVRTILRLPAEVRPQQVISLLGLGGPSFPLGDHGDHIHVGY